MKILSSFEYDEINYEITKDEEKIEETDKVDVLHLKEDSIKRLEKLEELNIVEIRWKKIKFQNYVGVIFFENFAIEILPKFLRSSDSDKNKDQIYYNLLKMLDYVNWFDIGIKDDFDFAYLGKEINLFEIFVYLFAKNLLKILKTNRDFSYVREYDELKCVKGRIDFKNYLNPARLQIIPCFYFERNMNTIINRLLKYVSFLLVKKIRSDEVKRLLKNILSVLDPVSLSPVKLSDIQNLTFSRLNICFKPYVEFCKLILKNSTLSLQASETEFFTFFIPMEKLFERFIAKAFEEIREKDHKIKNVDIQKPLGYFGTKNKNGEQLFQLIPDIVIVKEDEIIVIDTKYKVLSPKDKKLEIDQQDLYQIYVYCKHLSENNTYVRGILIYPQSEKDVDETFKLGKEGIPLRVKTIPLYNLFENKNLSKSFKDKLQDLLNKKE